jgi:virulence-associated protein VapD
VHGATAIRQAFENTGKELNRFHFSAEQGKSYAAAASTNQTVRSRQDVELRMPNPALQHNIQTRLLTATGAGNV